MILDIGFKGLIYFCSLLLDSDTFICTFGDPSFECEPSWCCKITKNRTKNACAFSTANCSLCKCISVRTTLLCSCLTGKEQQQPFTSENHLRDAVKENYLNIIQLLFFSCQLDLILLLSWLSSQKLLLS